MAQKFITKKNRHLFRRPVKAKIEENVTITFPTQKPVVIEPVLVTPEIIETEQEIILDETLEVENYKKKKTKKVKETEGELETENKE